MRSLCRALAEGFAYQGKRPRYQGDKPRGEPSAHLPPTAFVTFLQNHDQIGNRAHGERLSAARHERPARCAQRRLLLLAPSPPDALHGRGMGRAEPFPYFCDFEPELAEKMREGRRARIRALRQICGGQRAARPCVRRDVRSRARSTGARSQQPHARGLARSVSAAAGDPQARHRAAHPARSGLGSCMQLEDERRLRGRLGAR